MDERDQNFTLISDKLDFFDRFGKAVVVLSSNFTIYACNQTFSDVYLHIGEPLQGKSLLQLMCPDDWITCKSLLEELINGERNSVQTQKRFKDPLGKFRWTNVIATQWQSPSGEAFTLIFFDDISVLKKTQERLQYSEVKYSKLIENLPVAVFHIDLQQIEPSVYFSKKFEQLFGISLNDMEQGFGGLKRYIHPDDLEKFNHSHGEMKAQNDLIITEYRLINDFKEQFWVRERAQLVRNAQGRIEQIYGVMMNISAEVKARKQLQRFELKHQAILESASDRIAILSPEGQLVYANSHFFSNLGISREEYFSSQLDDFLHPDDREKHLRALQEVIHTGYLSYEYRIIHQNGTCLHMQNKLSLLKDENGNTEGILSINRDITKIKEYEQQLIHSRSKAEESDRLKSAFLANMSHEIRTPLNGIIGFSKLLSGSQVFDEKKKLYSDIIERNSQQLLSLISDIIDIAKIESNQLKISVEVMNLNDLLDEIYQIFANDLRIHDEKQVILELQKDLPREKAFIRADRLRIAQLFNNLLSNALKFTYKGIIQFGYRFSGSDFLFFVSDTGIGIDTEMQELIFQPFRQEDESMTRKYGGTGLGLAICKKLVLLMDGKMWLESEKGKGSIFYFRLRLPLSNPVSGSLPVSTAKNFVWPGKLILIVDDNKDILAYMNEIFSQTEAKVILAESGEEAIEICNWAEKIDLVLMDIQMPAMDGFKAIREIQKLNPDLPIIAQTAYAMAGDDKKCLQAGCVAYISKPVDAQKLFQLISAFL